MIGRDRQRKMTVHLDRVIERKVKVDRRKSASSVKTEGASELGIFISEQTVRFRLHEVGFKDRVARRKPYMDKTNRMKRFRIYSKVSGEAIRFLVSCVVD